MDNKVYISPKEATKLCGVTNRTLFNWFKQNKVSCVRAKSGVKRYNKQDLLNIIGLNNVVTKPGPEPNIKKKYCYCRVSSRNQVDDLNRQIEFFKCMYPEYTIIKDCGSGINWKRKGFKTILEQAMLGNVEEVVVAHRDRLCRFAFELVEFILTKNNVKLVVLSQTKNESGTNELADNILSIVQIYACRRNGKRRYKTSTSGKKSKDLPN